MGFEEEQGQVHDSRLIVHLLQINISAIWVERCVRLISGQWRATAEATPGQRKPQPERQRPHGLPFSLETFQ